jgi:hypothetical protein
MHVPILIQELCFSIDLVSFRLLSNFMRNATVKVKVILIEVNVSEHVLREELEWAFGSPLAEIKALGVVIDH